MKKIVLAVLSVVAVFAALGTTTFAWFTLSGTATVGTIEVNVESGVGIELSLDGTNWKPNFTAAELETELSKVAANHNFPAASPSSFKFSAVNLTATSPSEDPADLVDSTSSLGFQKIKLDGSFDSAVANKDFIEFSLYIRVKGSGSTIQWVNPIDSSSVKYPAITSEGVDWTADAPVKINGTAATVDAKYMAAAQNAARVAVGHTIVEAATDAEALNEGGTLVGTPIKNTVLGVPATGDLTTDKGSHEYFETKHPGVLTPAILTAAEELLKKYDEGTPGTADTWQVKTTADLNAANGHTMNEALSLSSNDWYETEEIKVRIWLDGWDYDCFDAIYADNLLVNLRFEAKAA